MDFPTIVTIVGGILTIANGWVLVLMNNQREAFRELRHQDAELAKDLGAVKLLVAGQYVTRTEFSEGLSSQSNLLLGRMDALSKQIASK